MTHAFQPGSAVIWAGHADIYLIIERTEHVALLREWGQSDHPMRWTMISELTPIGENEAVRRLCEQHRLTTPRNGV